MAHKERRGRPKGTTWSDEQKEARRQKHIEACIRGLAQSEGKVDFLIPERVVSFLFSQGRTKTLEMVQRGELPDGVMVGNKKLWSYQTIREAQSRLLAKRSA